MPGLGRNQSDHAGKPASLPRAIDENTLALSGYD
jgi:hypothetical protein